MKTLFFTLVISVLIIAVIVSLLINQEEKNMYRFKDLCIRLVQKFDSWQIMR